MGLTAEEIQRRRDVVAKGVIGQIQGHAWFIRFFAFAELHPNIADGYSPPSDYAVPYDELINEYIEAIRACAARR